MASERDLDLLDDYLRNKLSAQDKSAFEKVLKNDSALQKEMRVQQEVINSLRSKRVAELKQLLNNVPVSALPAEVTGTSALAKIAALLVVASLIGGGLYVYFHSEDQPADTITANTPALDQQASPSKDQSSSAANDLQPPVEQSDATEDVAGKSATPELNEGSRITDKKADSVAPAARNVFEPGEEVKTTEPSTPSDSGKGTSGTISTPSIAIEAGINGNNGKYNFHYQFKDNKLLLYGVFEKNLYELMEFFSNNKRTLFLYYKDNYYLLNDEDNKVQRLAPISDPVLIKKLKDYRAAR